MELLSGSPSLLLNAAQAVDDYLFELMSRAFMKQKPLTEEGQ